MYIWTGSEYRLPESGSVSYTHLELMELERKNMENQLFGPEGKMNPLGDVRPIEELLYENNDERTLSAEGKSPMEIEPVFV